MHQLNYKYIAIEGNIGAGKSTLAKMFGEKLNASLILEEFEDNSFLPKFYKDPRRFAFPLEMSFLAARFNQLKNKLIQPALFNSCVISDYIFAKCLLFSKVNLEYDEFNLYLKLFEIMNLQLPQPDLLIYLHNNVERLQYNIKLRGRKYEQEISNDYLLNLQHAYFDYMYNLQNQPILVVNCTYADFVANPNHFSQIFNCIYKEFKPGITTLEIK
jgi:deoxyadenosine/deoxycytidine kinase